MLPLEHSHITSLSSRLEQLQVLDLAGCKKLKPTVTQILMQKGLLQQLQCLNLQRCFQLTDACLSDVLVQSSSRDSASDGSSASTKALQCVALSHLNMASWPADSAAALQLGAGASSAVHVDDTVGDSNRSRYWYQLQQTVTNSLQRLPVALEELGPFAPATGSGGSLRVVALNNCNQLSVEGLITLALSCPRLEYLMLGGSSLKAVTAAANTSAVYVPPGVVAALAAGGTDSTVSTSAAELPAALQQLSDSLQLPADLPWEALSSCCHVSGTHGACDCSCSCCSDSRSSSTKNGRNTRLLLVQNQPSPAAIAASRSQALALAYAVALMPQLKAMEVTFMASGIAGWLRQAMQCLQELRSSSTTNGSSSSSSADHSHCSSMRRNDNRHATMRSCDESHCSNSNIVRSTYSCVPQVWEFSCVNAVQQASSVMKQQSPTRHSCARTGAATTDRLHSSCLPTAVRCAANCSTRGRSTPLHAAAYTGCCCHLAALLQAGAMINARDGGGASPLFVAAEAGKAAAVAVLLAAGADGLVGNSAGEMPLYIAALRGHLAVVRLLVEHFSAAGVDWMNGRLYGDAWTPLMAAAVANRVDVAMYLLRAATEHKKNVAAAGKLLGPFNTGQKVQWHTRSWFQQQCSLDNSSSRWGGYGGSVQKLLAAENRYGQTALHIAARKGCRELLQLLLLYGAGQVAGRLADAAGDTPLDIARRHGHQMVLHELLQHC